MYEDMPCMHRILHAGKNSEDYTFIMNMMIIALMLALVEKPTTT